MFLMAYSITIDVPTMFHVVFSITIIVQLSSKTALCCKTRQGQWGVAGDYERNGRGCGAPPEWGVELPLPILQYLSHKSCQPHLNGGGAEHTRSEGWSFPCLFCGTQVTRVIGPLKPGSFSRGQFCTFLRGGAPPLLRNVQRIVRVPP